MVDWRVARRIAAGIAGEEEPPVLPGDLAALCVDAEQRVSAYAQLEVLTPLPAPEAVSRAGWTEANLSGMRSVLDPIAAKIGTGKGPFAPAMRSAGGLLLGVEVGGMLGLLSQRVLGQYEVPPNDPERPARLLFVAPNLHDAARKLAVDEEQMLRWVVLHETTHAVQFSSVPWLRAHVAAMVDELSAALDVKIELRAVLRLRGDDLREAVQRLREEGLMAVAMGPGRKELLDRVQATMALIEGHAEHVMDATGAEVLPDLEALRSALERRRRDRPPLLRIFEKLMGLEMKMRQYDVGKRFCDAVAEREGVPALNRAWASPESLPTWEEMEDPQRWLARTTPV